MSCQASEHWAPKDLMNMADPKLFAGCPSHFLELASYQGFQCAIYLFLIQSNQNYVINRWMNMIVSKMSKCPSLCCPLCGH